YQSALTFNKKDCIAVLEKYGIPHAKSVYIKAPKLFASANNPKGSFFDESQIDEIINKIGLPCFVKPNQSGSSLGISKVKSKEEFEPALEKAFKEDNRSDEHTTELH